MVTPLQPREFFRASWIGDGEFIPHPFLRWLLRREALRLSSQPQWLSDTIWLVKDRFEFSSGRVLERQMFCELVAPDRIHCTADDMPRCRYSAARTELSLHPVLCPGSLPGRWPDLSSVVPG